MPERIKKTHKHKHMTQILDIGIAHQKIIRDKKSKTDKQNLFGAYWEHIDLDLKNAEVKEITLVTAKNMVEEYEWL